VLDVIFEGLVTTLDQDGSVHLAPMGSEFGPRAALAQSDQLILKPYQMSSTFANLHRTGQCVFHLTDDVELIAAAAIGQVAEMPRHHPASQIVGAILSDACRWYALQVESEDLREARAVIQCRVVAEGTQREFLGFNRARHAVIEAAILATRTSFLDRVVIEEDLARLRPLVEKTGGETERRAFRMLGEFIHQTPRKAAPLATDTVGRAEVTVRAPARLHFGLFSFGNLGRQYGGTGVMIKEPAVRLAIRPAACFSVAGAMSTEVRSCVDRCAAAWKWEALPACCVEVVSTPPRHAGLGSGTQLACAVAAGLTAWCGRPVPSAEALVQWTGRGQRSAVGTFGFLMGGLVVEGGRLPAEPLSPLLYRLPVPASWRFILARPHLAGGLSGDDELRAFATLESVPSATREALVREVEGELIPALAAKDCQAFGESVYRYGRLAGSCFAAVQGGPYHGPEITHLVTTLRELGIAGVGQSSWGPTVFGVVDSQETAERMADQLSHRYAAIPLSIGITAADNRGAEVLWNNGPPESEV
jgi:beta-RFAP synthase